MMLPPAGMLGGIRTRMSVEPGCRGGGRGGCGGAGAPAAPRRMRRRVPVRTFVCVIWARSTRQVPPGKCDNKIWPRAGAASSALQATSSMGIHTFGWLSHCQLPEGVVRGGAGGGAVGGAGASCCHCVRVCDGGGGVLSCCHGVGCDVV